MVSKLRYEKIENKRDVKFLNLGWLSVIYDG